MTVYIPLKSIQSETYNITMEKRQAPKIERLLKGLHQLSKGNHQFQYTYGTRTMTCRIDTHWHKKLSRISQIPIYQISSRFSTHTILQPEQLGKKCQQIVFSGDSQLVLKVVTLIDMRKFQKLLDDYVQYLKSHPQSLITRILTVFTVKTIDFNVNDFVILMESVRPGVEHTAYDVKGLLEGREMEEGEVTTTKFGKDFQIVSSRDVEVLRANQRQLSGVWERLGEDLEFLKKHMVMDYSMILCFYREAPQKELRNQVKLEDGSYCSFGLIDYLQEYNTIKKMEGAFKGLFKTTQISTVDCQLYSKRMLQFIDKYMKPHPQP